MSIVPDFTNVVNPQGVNGGAKMLGAALFYAKRLGWAVFPVHVPIHNEAGECIGCTCEHYKRSEAYRLKLVELGRGHQFDPNYRCPQPGKCPAVKWRDKSTTDEATIHRWWGRPWRAGAVSFMPNIGLDCGKSGVLVHDADTYKPDYGGADYLSMADRQTVTAQTGKGGEHLFYDAQGLPYGNDNAALPYGNDIRGVGGYVVLTPSLHATGRRCQWEEGYSPRDCALAPIPDALRAILDEAHQKKQTRRAAAVNVKFGDAIGPAPDLAQWNLPPWVVDGIHTPPARGKRSEHDYGVVIGLCKVGLTDDEIHAVFAHYPVGLAGKYAERGPDYLARTITNARGALAEQERWAATVAQTIEGARQWVRRADFSEHVPLELQAANGYRTADTDKAIALGALSIFASYGKLEGPVSVYQLSEATGRSTMTCGRAMARLCGWFVECINDDDRAPDEARRYRLNPGLIACCVHDTRFPDGENCEPCIMYATLPMDTHRAHDAFIRSMRPLDPAELAERIEARKSEGKRPSATGDERRRVRATLPSAGPAALVVVDALTEFGPLRPGELATLTAKSKYAISRAVGRLRTLELAEVDAAGAVYLVDGWADHLNEIAPQMPTAGTVRRRILARADATITQCEELLQTASDEQRKWLHRRMERAKATKVRIARAEGFDSKESQAAAAAPNTALTYWDLRKIQHLEQMHANAQMDAAEQRRRPEWELNKSARQLRADGLGKQHAVRMLEYAGYTKNEAWDAVHRAWGVYAEVVA